MHGRSRRFLKEKDVPVIITGIQSLPIREDDAYDTLYENAAKLKAAGVRFCISTGNSGADVRTLPFHAGLAARFRLAQRGSTESGHPLSSSNHGRRRSVGHRLKRESWPIWWSLTAICWKCVPTCVICSLTAARCRSPAAHTQLNDAFKDRAVRQCAFNTCLRLKLMMTIEQPAG